MPLGSSSVIAVLNPVTPSIARTSTASRQDGGQLGEPLLEHSFGTALDHAELARKGIDTETARTALDQVDPADEEAAARRLLAKKAAATRGVPPEKRRRRLVSMLARKGYPPSMAFRLVDEALAADVDGGSAELDGGYSGLDAN